MRRTSRFGGGRIGGRRRSRQPASAAEGGGDGEEGESGSGGGTGHGVAGHPETAGGDEQQDVGDLEAAQAAMPAWQRRRKVSLMRIVPRMSESGPESR